MSAEFTGDHDLHIVFGDRNDGVELLFERPAVERFVALATELLAMPILGDPKADLPKLYAPDVCPVSQS